jgi:hypothetical protein
VAKTVNKKIVVVLVLKHAYFHLNSSMYDIQKRSLNEVEIDLKLRFFIQEKTLVLPTIHSSWQKQSTKK